MHKSRKWEILPFKIFLTNRIQGRKKQRAKKESKPYFKIILFVSKS